MNYVKSKNSGKSGCTAYEGLERVNYKKWLVEEKGIPEDQLEDLSLWNDLEIGSALSSNKIK